MRFGDYTPYACAWDNDYLIVDSKDNIEKEIIELWFEGASVSGPWKLERLINNSKLVDKVERFAVREGDRFLMLHPSDFDFNNPPKHFEEVFAMRKVEFDVRVSIGDVL